MKTVNILLCTYNGQQYVETLLGCLLAQTYRNIHIYIRDDGSQDSTPQILSRYDGLYEDGITVTVLHDNKGNLGYVANFLHVARASGDADYYAFCDQDDFWLPEKIQRAVTALDSLASNRCLLYSSAYEVRDKDLNPISVGHPPTPFEKLDIGKSLSLYDGGWLLGFTLVINRTLKQYAFDNNAVKMYSHDIWVQAVALGFSGEFIYDEKITAYFRRHEESTSIAEADVANTGFQIWKYRLNEFLGNGNMFSRLKSGIQTYANLYRDKVINPKDRTFLNTFANPDGKAHRLRKLLYPCRLKQKLMLELLWRFAILMGKI